MAVADPVSATGAVAGDLLEVPVFPLGTVLFPGGRLPLQIFETRYVDMVRRCVRADSPFLVVLIRDGHEARQGADEGPPQHAEVGTLAWIRDFTELPNGMLGITVAGERRAELCDRWEQSDHLLVGQVRLLAEPEPQPLADEYASFRELLQHLLVHPVVRELGLDVDLDDGSAVAAVLTDLLPLDPAFKQELLELSDTDIRLAALQARLHALQQQDATDA